MAGERTERPSGWEPLRGAVTLFARLHAAPSLHRPALVALTVVGVALGTAMFVGIAVLYVALARPFSALSDVASRRADFQVTPFVEGRLPDSAVTTMRGTDGVAAVYPTVGGLTTLTSRKGASGIHLLGTDCAIEDLVGRFGCRELKMASGPGAPLALGSRLARELDAKPGDPLGLPGRTFPAAHVGAVLSAGPSILDEGRFVIGTLGDVQALRGSPGFVDTAFVATASKGVATTVATSVRSVAQVGPPAAPLRNIVSMARQILLFSAMLVLVCGVLVATSSFALSFEDRQRSIALIEMLGSTRRRVVLSFATEGALLGVAGGLVALPVGYWLGILFTGWFGDSLLRGSGTELTARFAPWVVAAALLTGMAGGIVAALPPALRLARDDNSAPTSERYGTIQVPSPPKNAMFGVGFMPVGIVLVLAYGSGYAPLAVALAGVEVAVFGFLSFTVGSCALVLRFVTRKVVSARAAGPVLMLSLADLARDPLRLTAVVTTVALGAGASMALAGGRELIAGAVERDVARESRGRVYVFPKRFTAHADAAFADATVRLIGHVPGVSAVRPHSVAVVETEGAQVSVAGTDPSSPRRNLDILDSSPAEAWGKVARGAVILSRTFANSRGAHAGGTIVLPTLAGPRRFDIAAIASTGYAEDNGIGALVTVSRKSADKWWAAPTAFVEVVPRAGVSPRQLAERLRRLQVPEMHVYSPSEAAEEAGRVIGTVLRPVISIAYVMLVISGAAVAAFLLLGLEQRARLRAVFRSLGFTTRHEASALLAQALLMATLGACFGAGAALLCSWLEAVMAPALLGTEVAFRPPWASLALGVAGAWLTCMAAALPAALHARRLEVARVLGLE